MTEPEQLQGLKWEVLLRYRYIELITLWEGRLTTKHLCTSFGIQRQQASKDINQYKQLAPNNLIYNQQLKGYTPAESFKCLFTLGRADEYLQLLDSSSFLEGCIERIELPQTYTEVLRAPTRQVAPEIVRQIVAACRSGSRLDINYASFNNPRGEARMISPHALVSSGHRWHARAYCERNRCFCDFVLGRILECGEVEGDALVNPEEDRLWQEQLTLKVIPNPALTFDQQAMIRKERGLEGDHLLLNTRKATALYLLQLMQIPDCPTGTSQSEARAHPLVLADYAQINDLRICNSDAD